VQNLDEDNPTPLELGQIARDSAGVVKTLT